MALKCWVASANDPSTDFPIQNLPYGVFRYGNQTHIGIAIGDKILDLHACGVGGLLVGVSAEARNACLSETLNELMELGPEVWSALRREVTNLLSGEAHSEVEKSLVPMCEVEMQLPARTGDYTDFYASIDHARRVGKLFRPDNPLLPNYKYLPVGYHGRASSIVVSGFPIRRPQGQTKPADSEPLFAPSKSVDYELEIGAFVGPGNRLGNPISINEAEKHIFGLCLVNDWSARDLQAWEYQPLGPFLAKSFATSVSPWVVSMEALAPYRVPVRSRGKDDPALLDYLQPLDTQKCAIDLTLEVYLASLKMRQAGIPPERISRSNLRDLYWTFAQFVTHHTSNGCNLRSGDLLATGTVSGPLEGSEGCLLEMRHRAVRLRLPTGEERVFLEDEDRVIFRAFTERHNLPRIGFGLCEGIVKKHR
ncbi:MAG: fumarylacetoacetase [Acidobacteriota bacterium]|nr:fumarylacetoacetase [Acidobacteriota bacterium]